MFVCKYLRIKIVFKQNGGESFGIGFDFVQSNKITLPKCRLCIDRLNVMLVSIRILITNDDAFQITASYNILN